jgi:hypothetical protein
MIYELRRYECLPGKLPSLHKLMEQLAVPIFKKHGMRVVGAWSPLVGDAEATLIYMLSWNSMDEWKAKWKAFKADPEWLEKRAEFAKKEGGPLVARITNSFLDPTSYSPLQ